MDLDTITSIRRPVDRSELDLGDREALLGGGSWLFSEPQDHLTGLVDLTALGWRPIVMTDVAVRIAATCTLGELAALPAGRDWIAHPLIRQSCEALLGSFKVQNVATVGGNVALALPAGPMTSLLAGLDAVATVWTSDGGERREPIAELVTGVQTTTLATGEVLRSIEIPLASLRSPAGFRRIALSPVGRSGTLVIARRDGAGFVVTVTAGTERPVQLRYEGMPTSAELTADIAAIDCWYDDAHGAPDWRAAMATRFAEQLREELAP